MRISDWSSDVCSSDLEEGENLGVMLTAEAIEQAASVGLDLVEVSPNADPPVCKFLDVGKFKYEAQKKANLARKSQRTQEIKRSEESREGKECVSTCKSRWSPST